MGMSINADTQWASNDDKRLFIKSFINKFPPIKVLL